MRDDFAVRKRLYKLLTVSWIIGSTLALILAALLGGGPCFSIVALVLFVLEVFRMKLMHNAFHGGRHNSSQEMMQ